MPIPAHDLEDMIRDAFPDAKIEITALVNDNDHFHATITSKFFVGKSRIQQHQMVYAALKGCVGETLHALSLTTIPNTEQ
jgi:stress-induced morphogen